LIVATPDCSPFEGRLQDHRSVAPRSRGTEPVKQFGEVSRVRNVSPADIDRVSAQAMTFHHAWFLLNRLQERRVGGSGDICEYEGAQRSPQRGRLNHGTVAGDDSSFFETSNSFDHCRAGEADSLRERLHREPTIRLELSQNSLVDRIYL
jgi:hypothetical protein